MVSFINYLNNNTKWYTVKKRSIQMITAISSVNKNDSKVGFKKQATPVSFKGNLARAGGSLLGDTFAKQGRSLAGEATEVAGKAFRKVAGDELPVSKKPVVAPIVDELMDQLTDGTPVGGIIRTANGVRKGDAHQIVKGGAAIVDNTVFLPAKLAVMAEAAAIGTAICPGIGTVAGPLLVLFGWGKARNAIVDGFMKK